MKYSLLPSLRRRKEDVRVTEVVPPTESQQLSTVRGSHRFAELKPPHRYRFDIGNSNTYIFYRYLFPYVI